MTISSANSFLKTFEEANENTLIITTTSNPNQLLDTILSRALIVKFNIPIYTDTIDFLIEKYPEKDISELKTILSFCM
jgi:DNA polymerase III gamma/tau subunit